MLLKTHLSTEMLRTFRSLPQCTTSLIRTSSVLKPHCTSTFAAPTRRFIHASPVCRDIQPHPAQNVSSSDILLRTSLQFSLPHTPGALVSCLTEFSTRNINVIQLKSREGRDTDKGKGTTMYADLDGHIDQSHVSEAINALRRKCPLVNVMGSYIAPHFPTCIEELHDAVQIDMREGPRINLNDPGFFDRSHRDRHWELTYTHPRKYRPGEPIPPVKYTDEENQTWRFLYDNLQKRFTSHTCREYQYMFPLLVENCGYGPNEIPQMEDISQFLRQQTGFTIRPIGGPLSARVFMTCLAFRVLPASLHVRHHSRPDYISLPDVCHEYLGATDDDIMKLATCYWFSAEKGMCRQGGQFRAYGAQLLTTFNELEYCITNKPEHLPWDPFKVCKQPYEVCGFPSEYFFVEGFASAKEKMEEFAASLQKPFKLEYNPVSQSVKIISLNSERFMKSVSWE